MFNVIPYITPQTNETPLLGVIRSHYHQRHSRFFTVDFYQALDNEGAAWCL
jgi:hypothetical protein